MGDVFGWQVRELTRTSQLLETERVCDNRRAQCPYVSLVLADDRGFVASG